MEIWLAILLIVIAAIVTGLCCFNAGVNHRKKIAEAEIGSAETEAKRIVDEAVKEAEAKKKEYVLEGKEEVQAFRAETEKDLNARRKEVQRQERRVQQKEETLDRKMDNLEKVEQLVNKTGCRKKKKMLPISLNRLRSGSRKPNLSRKVSLSFWKKFRDLLRNKRRNTCLLSSKQSLRMKKQLELWTLNKSCVKSPRKRQEILYLLQFKDAPPTMSQKRQCLLFHCPTMK